MQTDDQPKTSDPIEAESAAVQATASSAVPDEMEAAIASPRNQGACIFANNFGYQLVTNENGDYIGDVVWVTDTNSILGLSQGEAEEMTDAAVSEHSSVDDLLEAYERAND